MVPSAASSSTSASSPQAVSGIVAITGASGALGSDVARRLVRDGYRVALLDTARSRERLEMLAAELGRAAWALAVDVADPRAWADALEKIESAHGARPTHAVLVAGGWQGGLPLHEADDAVWSAMVTSNLETAYRSLRALLPAMVEKKSGSIVLVGSRAAARPWTGANAAAYTATKAGVVAIAEAVAAEVLSKNVRVNSILPSTLDTPANRAAMPKSDPAEWVSTTSAAGVIAFLLSDAARDVSGAALPVYGRA